MCTGDGYSRPVNGIVVWVCVCARAQCSPYIILSMKQRERLDLFIFFFNLLLPQQKKKRFNSKPPVRLFVFRFIPLNPHWILMYEPTHISRAQKTQNAERT